MNTGLSASRAQTPFLAPTVESGSGDNLGGGRVRSETRPQVPLSQPHNGSSKATSSASPHQAVRSQTGVHQAPSGTPYSLIKKGVGVQVTPEFLQSLERHYATGCLQKMPLSACPGRQAAGRDEL